MGDNSHSNDDGDGKIGAGDRIRIRSILTIPTSERKMFKIDADFQ